MSVASQKLARAEAKVNQAVEDCKTHSDLSPDHPLRRQAIIDYGTSTRALSKIRDEQQAAGDRTKDLVKAADGYKAALALADQLRKSYSLAVDNLEVKDPTRQKLRKDFHSAMVEVDDRKDGLLQAAKR